MLSNRPLSLLGRSEEEDVLRDAVLLTAAGGDPGLAGKLFLATRMLTRRYQIPGTPVVKELTTLFSIRWDDDLASVTDLIDMAIQSGRASPLVVPDLISAIAPLRPDAEVLALGVADVMLALKLKWPKPVSRFGIEGFGAVVRLAYEGLSPGDAVVLKALTDMTRERAGSRKIVHQTQSS